MSQYTLDYNVNLSLREINISGILHSIIVILLEVMDGFSRSAVFKMIKVRVGTIGGPFLRSTLLYQKGINQSFSRVLLEFL